MDMDYVGTSTAKRFSGASISDTVPSRPEVSREIDEIHANLDGLMGSIKHFEECLSGVLRPELATNKGSGERTGAKTTVGNLLQEANVKILAATMAVNDLRSRLEI